MKTTRIQNLIAPALTGALAFTSAYAQQVPIPTSAAEVPGPVPGNTMTKAYVQFVGHMAYIWGYPMVNAHNRRAAFAEAPAPGLLGGVVPLAPVGYNAMLTDYIKPDERFIVCPNQDVAYGAGFTALDKEPTVVQVPDFGDRFYVYALYDQRTDEIAQIGKQYGTKAGFYMIAGANWNGTVPPGITAVVRSSTDLVFVVPRVFKDDTAEDTTAVQPLISQVMMYPLSKFDGKMKTTDWSKLPHFPVPKQHVPKGESRWVNPATYYEELPVVMKEVPPLPGEEALYGWIKAVWEAAARDPKTKQALIASFVAANGELVDPWFQFQYNGRGVGHGWTAAANASQWGTDYLNYSGSVVKQGEMEAVVIGTGSNTFFGRTAKLVAGAGAVSHAQKAMFQIGNFLIVVAVALALIMVAAKVYHDIVIAKDWGVADALGILQFVLVLLVASIPVAMPAVFSITMALGALGLSKQKAIVSKLSAIEEMAGVDILCSDKTGTLTKNQLTLGDPILFAAKDPQDCILAAALASKIEDRDAIDTAVIAALKDQNAVKSWKQTKFVPFDPVTKRTAATVTDAGGKTVVVTKGAPQVIVDLAKPAADVVQKVKQTVDELAAKGSRALGVARSEDGGATWSLLAVLPMFDPPRDDSKATIDKANQKGVRVKMVTGDDTAIAIETARQLGMGAHIIPAADAFPKDMDPNNVPPQIADAIERADGFARVFPEHKYAIVKALQARGHLVAMTGDGVNDAPALKQADCGTAVSGATDAARGAAALILTAPGLSVINSAIDEARRIFGRITSYTLYRVALTMDIMFVVVLSTIFLDFAPLTAIMIVAMSLLDDVPIMTIAYDNTPVSEKPIRWQMPHLLGVSAILSLFSIVESFGLLLIGMEVLSHPHGQGLFGLATKAQLQTVMFLQLVAGGHLLLFITRTERWFFLPPFPAAPLFWAIFLTQVVAVLMCAFGWLVTPISWSLVAAVWAYNLAWMFALGGVRLITERFVAYRTSRHIKSAAVVNQSLQPHVPAFVGASAGKA